MTSTPSIPSLVAASIYVAAIGTCIYAAVVAARCRQGQGHVQTWVGVCLLFSVLAISRFLGIEQSITEFLREHLKDSGLYDVRRSWQAPVVAVVTMIAGALGLVFAHRFVERQHGRRNHARSVAFISSCVMIVLVALRLASFHAIDSVLYGPLKLNWVIDLGSTIAVVVAAAYYARIVRQRP